MSTWPAKRAPTAVDAEVGRRVRMRRMVLGLSQEVLAKYLGLTYQQLQKYETGSNRINADRLHSIAVRLGVPVSYFFPESPAIGAATATEPASGVGDAAFPQATSGEAMKFILAYGRIRNSKMRKVIASLIDQLACPGEG